jgi:hypothetical protein
MYYGTDLSDFFFLPGTKIDFPAAGPAGNVEKDLIDVMTKTLERH